MKVIVDIDKDTLERIKAAKCVPDMYGTDIVNGLNALKYSKPYGSEGTDNG